jgi:HJR/Mrr/RecB family endonuclease
MNRERDVRSGGEFEEYLTNLFQALGYKAENTKISGDQGIDVLVARNGKKYGIQAKYYSQPVGNSAVQEVIAGREYFNLSKGIVITNASFTKSAQDLAEKTHIRLIDGEELEKIIRMEKSGKGNSFIL